MLLQQRALVPVRQQPAPRRVPPASRRGAHRAGRTTTGCPRQRRAPAHRRAAHAHLNVAVRVVRRDGYYHGCVHVVQQRLPRVPPPASVHLASPAGLPLALFPLAERHRALAVPLRVVTLGPPLPAALGGLALLLAPRVLREAHLCPDVVAPLGLLEAQREVRLEVRVGPHDDGVSPLLLVDVLGVDLVHQQAVGVRLLAHHHQAQRLRALQVLHRNVARATVVPLPRLRQPVQLHARHGCCPTRRAR